MKPKEMMDRLTAFALELSIEKWQDIVDGKGEELGDDNCALCQVFGHLDCKDCPVSKKTGDIGCDSTPYMDYDPDNPKNHIAVAKKEVKFLKSLRKQK